MSGRPSEIWDVGTWNTENRRRPSNCISRSRRPPCPNGHVRAVGLAGLTVAYAQQGQTQKAAELYQQLTSEQLEPHIDDEYLRSALARVRRRWGGSR